MFCPVAPSSEPLMEEVDQQQQISACTRNTFSLTTEVLPAKCEVSKVKALVMQQMCCQNYMIAHWRLQKLAFSVDFMCSYIVCKYAHCQTNVVV